MTTLGVIADTHGYLDQQVLEIFHGVHHILHAGDIGPPSLLHELEQVAPVTAVFGNTDDLPELPDTQVLCLDGRKFLVHHALDVCSTSAPIHRRILREAPDIVVFGHSHRPYSERIGTTWYLNPGYAGRPRFRLPRSVAILRCTADGIAAEFCELQPPRLVGAFRGDR